MTNFSRSFPYLKNDASQKVVRRFYFTALSNFAIGYDRYTRTYSKRNIKESRFPTRFYLLNEASQYIGLERARELVGKLALPHDDIVAFETSVNVEDLHENTATGLGQYIESDTINLTAVYGVDKAGKLFSLSVEDAYARSMRSVRTKLPSWNEAIPRSVSILPIAKGCQAACSFCFSEGSISKDQSQSGLDENRIMKVLQEAQARGAKRAVITGGGEPGLLAHDALCNMIRMAAAHFDKVVLITNGYFLGRLDEETRRQTLADLADAGLTVLSISRHHYNPTQHQQIMKLSTSCEAIAASWRAIQPGIGKKLKLRWVCVLQSGGIDTSAKVEAYLRWAASQSVGEVCFKELYVSSGIESVYSDLASNMYSATHQVPLRIVDVAHKQNWQLELILPWGAPVFQLNVEGKQMSVAAYTEPSVAWELRNKMCRSWNLMADGQCYASLEDLESLQDIPHDA